MALRRRLSRVRYGNRRASRRYRWAIASVDPVSLGPGDAVTFNLLSPIQPPSNLTDSIYQQMTNPTIIAVMGHVTIYSLPPVSCNTYLPSTADYAWGLYVDKDAASVTTAITPWSFGYTSTWMMWHSGTVGSGGQVVCPTGVEGQTQTSPLQMSDLAYRRYELRQRKYKRKLDSFNDTFVFAVENAPATASERGIGVSAYFRMLLLE